MMEPSGAGPPNDDHRIARPASWTLHSRRRALREQDFQTIGVRSHAEIALAVRDPCPRFLHDFTVSDGSYVEGARKGLAVMMKDSKKYASTGGWGFQFWEGGDPKKPQVTDAAKQCFACHQPKKDLDYVYSTYIP